MNATFAKQAANRGPVLHSLVCLALLAGPRAAGGEIVFAISEASNDAPIPARVHLTDARGAPVVPPGVPSWRDHFVTDGQSAVSLPDGSYAYVVERGPERRPVAGAVTVASRPTAEPVRLTRLANLRAEGWRSGDLHIHRDPSDVPLLMRAEDLDVGPVITWWNARNRWANQGPPKDPLRAFDGGERFIHVLAGEDERGGGAPPYFNLKAPLPIAAAQREHPSSAVFLRQAAAAPNAWIDVEKPFWWDVPLWLASGHVDSVGLANNHMCRSSMYESEAWGKPRDSARLPAPLGNGFWSQEIYYHILNAGFRLPPSAGSASGVLPNPVGYNRVYVYCGDAFSYESWWRNLAAGRCFVTNGPLLRVKANGRHAGAVFTAGADGAIEVSLDILFDSATPTPALEVIHNGRVVRSFALANPLSARARERLTLAEPGWFLIRAITEEKRTFRFASTAPFYLNDRDGRRAVDSEAVAFFQQWTEERMAAIRTALRDAPEKQREALAPWAQARAFWQERGRP